MAGADQPLAARRLVALAASAAVLATPGIARAADSRGTGVAQVNQATVVAAALTPVSGATCFAGCPAIVVSEPTALAVSFNIAAVIQVLTQSLGLH